MSALPEHSERFRVGFIDTDASGRIHYTVVFRWVEAAEASLHRKLGLLELGWGDFPRRKVEAEFVRPLGFEDEIELKLAVERVGTTSVTFRWEALHHGEIAIFGRHVTVRVDSEGRSIPIDEPYRRRLGAVT